MSPVLSRVRSRFMTKQDHERGSVTLEMVILYPAVLLFLGVIIHFGIMGHTNNIAHQAATIALQELRLERGADSAAVAAAHGYLSNTTLDGAWVEIAKGPERTSVTVSGTSPSFLPGLENQISETVTGPTERWVN